MTAKSSWLCPLCDLDHPGCEWRAGSLVCAVDACQNPHCQKRPYAERHLPARPTATRRKTR